MEGEGNKNHLRHIRIAKKVNFLQRGYYIDRTESTIKCC